MKASRIKSRYWDAAINAVQRNIFAMGARPNVSDEEDRILTAVFALCEQLTARNYLPVVPTNAELATKYAISPRTVRNWRREGCPFASGQWRVLDWLARRRYAPAGTIEKFGERLKRLKVKTFLKDTLAAARADILDLKAQHRALGVPMPDWLRGGHYRQR